MLAGYKHIVGRTDTYKQHEESGSKQIFTTDYSQKMPKCDLVFENNHAGQMA